METFGPYLLLKRLAQGGMGEVFLAREKRQRRPGPLVVVKRLLPALSREPEFIAMFTDEANIAAQLHHPNVARILDVGEAEGRHYLALEHVHGQTLRAVQLHAAEADGLPLEVVLHVVAGAARGLAHAHAAADADGASLGIIHRDVSPQNVMLGFDGSVKLIDFGIAKAKVKLSRTATGLIKGKYAYLSPEQARGDALDGRSDIFGLGIVLHELLTGERLFRRESDAATLKAVLLQPVKRPSSKVAALPRDVDAAVLQALARKRTLRFATADAFAATLESIATRHRLDATPARAGAFLRALLPSAATLDDERTLTR